LPGKQIINSTPQKGEDKVTDFNPSTKHESTLGTIIPTKVEHDDGFLQWGYARIIHVHGIFYFKP
jgi:hypothetical protein